jgi:2-dehydro-3-deoxyphosphogluconate aldolase / (4S)-4-hydroxy-2-oxoglutarate aldolase
MNQRTGSDGRTANLPTGGTEASALVSALRRAPILGVIRTQEPGAAGKIARAFAAGGIEALELSLTQSDALACITSISQDLPNEILIGAGTVTSARDAAAAVSAGARFLVTPTVSEDALAFAASCGVPVVCGALTPTEIRAALDLGAELVKIFPAGSVGPAYLRELLGPFPEARLVPTGGLKTSDLRAFRSAGAFAAGLGSALAPADVVRRGAWAEVSRAVADGLARWHQAALTR